MAHYAVQAKPHVYASGLKFLNVTEIRYAKDNELSV